jgi:heat shock protein HslJ
MGAPGAEAPVVPGTEITLTFQSGGQAGGSGGCNSYGSQYQVQDGTISFDAIITTEMACLDEGVMDQEQRYYQALQAAGTYELAGDQLKITSGDGQVVLNFVRSQPGTPTGPAGGADTLVNTRWTVVSIAEAGTASSPVAGSMVTLEFSSETQAGGNGGCNMYGAEVQIQDGSITFGPITSTKMACADDSVTQQEQRYFQALQSAASYELTGDQLVITSSDGQTVLTFTKAA